MISQILNFCNVLSSATPFQEEKDVSIRKEGWGPARDMSKLCEIPSPIGSQDVNLTMIPY